MLLPAWFGSAVHQFNQRHPPNAKSQLILLHRKLCIGCMEKPPVMSAATSSGNVLAGLMTPYMPLWQCTSKLQHLACLPGSVLASLQHRTCVGDRPDSAGRCCSIWWHMSCWLRLGSTLCSTFKGHASHKCRWASSTACLRFSSVLGFCR